MGFLSFVSGVVSTVGKWVKEAARPIVDTVKKVAKWVHDVAEVTEAHLEGKNIVFDDVNNKGRRDSDRYSDNRPEFLDSGDDKKLIVWLKESENAIKNLDERNVSEHTKLSLQIEVMELIISSQTFNRFANNIRLHDANLQIHYHTITNTLGLLQDINRQRIGLKAVIKQLNQVIFLLNKKGIDTEKNLDMIKNIDLDIKPGAISIAKAYEAFANTRDILIQELDSFITHTNDQILKAKKVREFSEKVPEKRNAINNWLDRKIIPMLENSKKQSLELLNSVKSIPLLEKENEIKIKEISKEETELDFPESENSI